MPDITFAHLSIVTLWFQKPFQNTDVATYFSVKDVSGKYELVSDRHSSIKEMNEPYIQL